MGTGALGAHPDHDAHMLSTLSGIQILLELDAIYKLDVDRVVKCASCIPLPHLPSLTNQFLICPLSLRCETESAMARLMHPLIHVN